MAALIFIIGLFVGGLLNVAIVRLPREKTLLGWPRCTRTGERLAWWQLLPLLGWLIQRGRARDGRSLHWIFPLVELLYALSLLRAYQLYGSSPAFFYVGFLAAVLLVTGAIDWLHRYIYTFVILGAAAIALVAGSFAGLDWRSLLLGALIGGVAFALLFMLARILYPGKSAPFGLGDVYLAIFIGASVGLLNLMPALFYGMLMAGVASAGILIARRSGRSTPEYISYGTYLCLGVLLYIALGGLS